MKRPLESSRRRQNPAKLHFIPLDDRIANGTEICIGHVCQQTTGRKVRMRNSVILTGPGRRPSKDLNHYHRI